MLHDSENMPQFKTITDEPSIEKYGGNRMYFAPSIDYDTVMRMIPFGKVITVGKIREYFAKKSGANFTEPITAGVFVSIAARASHRRIDDNSSLSKENLKNYPPEKVKANSQYFFLYKKIRKMNLWKNLKIENKTGIRIKRLVKTPTGNLSILFS